MTTAAIYVRQSKDATGDGLAVARQEALCRELAAARGFTVGKVYRDNDRSSKAGGKRPEYERLVHDYEAGRVAALLCYDLDRLTRVPRELEDWCDRTERSGLLIVTANGEADLGTDGGRMYARIKAAVARSEVERKGERQKAANRQRVMSGRVYGRKLTVGWHDLECTEPDEPVHERIRAAVADVLAGASLSSIAARWNAEGWRSPAGKPWSHVTARQFLVRPVNFGLVTYKDEEYRDVVAQWAPVLDVKTYDALRAELSSRGNATQTAATVRTFLLGGLLRCGKCGSTMTGATQKSGVNYLCSGRAHGCYRAVRASVADEYVLEETVRALLNHDPSDELPDEHLVRLRAIVRELETIARERAEVATSTVSVSAKLALMTDLDTRERGLRAESAELTKDAAVADMMRQITWPDPTDEEATTDALIEYHELTGRRLRKLSLRQQRFLVEKFGTYEVLDRSARGRVRRVRA
ncbi:recombinase family protein [Cellulosimicrobium cellulans]|uniref:recombinase family protein n=1 Tax=Cellulosimicrobium cellulans TaxID=1710 RepID=UPI001BAC31CD|nr:recombinase family protein [Cellulosimicrobium cellulans]QUC01090.1 recombinase family protein [Cellulosimicrobium cellulans]